LEEHVWGFWLLGLRLGRAVYEAREVNLLGLLGLRRRGNILDEALLDLGSETADQDGEGALHRGGARRFHPLERVSVCCASTALTACMSEQGQLFLILIQETSLFDEGRLSLDKSMLRSF